jgi:hypothetical protein
MIFWAPIKSLFIIFFKAISLALKASSLSDSCHLLWKKYSGNISHKVVNDYALSIFEQEISES